jgi:hypothetical protein
VLDQSEVVFESPRQAGDQDGARRFVRSREDVQGHALFERAYQHPDFSSVAGAKIQQQRLAAARIVAERGAVALNKLAKPLARDIAHLRQLQMDGFAATRRGGLQGESSPSNDFSVG